MQSTKRISRIQSKSVTKKVKTTVPPGQQAAMQASYLLGKSIRQTAREMHRDPAMVSKIVKSAQMDGIVLDMKEKFFGKLLPKALKSIQFALYKKTGGRLVRLSGVEGFGSGAWSKPNSQDVFDAEHNQDNIYKV